jgi:hypothetical protein
VRVKCESVVVIVYESVVMCSFECSVRSRVSGN